jgi:hypothetical protein
MIAMATTPMVVVETETFLERAKAIMTETERTDMVAYLASNPEAGQLIPGTGGARKIRWAVRGRGKRGGARTIYYYHNESIPLFILDIYAKNQKADLSEGDKRSLRRVLAQIPSQYTRRS